MTRIIKISYFLGLFTLTFEEIYSSAILSCARVCLKQDSNAPPSRWWHTRALFLRQWGPSWKMLLTLKRRLNMKLSNGKVYSRL